MRIGAVVVQDAGRFLAFGPPEAVLACREPGEVPDLLRDLDAACQRGKHLAGFFCYEAAAGLGFKTKTLEADSVPLVVFGVYPSPRVIVPPATPHEAPPVADWRPSLSQTAHARAISAIHERIAAGDTYQVNFTFQLTAAWDSDPWQLFGHLITAQDGGNAAYFDLGRHVVVSASPEMFFVLDGSAIEARPMKGTAPRGRSSIDDDRAAAALWASPKDRAENLMIVDMLRNDLGRVAEIGSVRVPRLFEIERYPTLHQMTSTVAGRTRRGPGEILAALFPCASITGAPKRRTMEIIASLESAPRGVYTGAIGWIAPQRRARFNVAIRTVVIDRERRLARYGVGSGIVADSVAAAEYEECLLKAQVLVHPAQRSQSTGLASSS